MPAVTAFYGSLTGNANIAKGECNGKEEKPRFFGFDIAEPHPILCKYTKKNLQPNKMTTYFIARQSSAPRSPRTSASASSAVRSNGPLCSSFNVHMAAAKRPASA